MRIVYLLGALMLLSLHTYAQGLTTYRFIGNGDFFIPSNWAGGLIPPHQLFSDRADIAQANIVIEGNCFTDGRSMSFASGSRFTVKSGGYMTFREFDFTVPGVPYDVFFPNGEVIVEQNAELDCFAWLNNVHKLRVHGTFKSGMAMGGNTSMADSMIISGSFYSGSFQSFFFGPVLIQNGGMMYVYPGRVLKLNGNTITVENGGTLDNRGSIIGGGIIRMANFTNISTLAPGNSPGTIAVDGNYMAGSGSAHNFEVGGVASNLYDQLNVTGTVTLSGQLNVSLINGFTPSAAHELPIITGASVTGTFTSTSIPPAYQLVYTATSVLLRRNSVLPVRFIDVRAMEENNHMLVRWTVGEELGVSRYEVETSADGRSYRTMTAVSASRADRYQAFVALPDARVFVRIRSIDQDGNNQISQVVEFRKGRSYVPFRAYPSPAKELVRVQFERLKEAGQMRVMNTSGMTVRTISISQGAQTMELDLQGLPAGVYLLQLLNKEGMQTCRFVKSGQGQ